MKFRSVVIIFSYYYLLWSKTLSINDHEIKNVESMISHAIKLQQEGKTNQARNIYYQVLEKDSLNADAHHFLGLIYFEEGDFSLAQTFIAPALSTKPKDAPILTNYAVILAQLGGNEEAEGILKHVVQVNNTYDAAIYNLAIVLENSGKMAEAEEMYLEMLKRQPQNEGSLVNLARIYESQKRYEEAVTAWSAFLQGQSEIKVADLMDYGVALHRSGKLDEAAAVYDQVLLAEPKHEMARLNLLAVLQEDGYIKEAIEQYWPLYYEDPENRYILNNFGTALLSQMDARGVELLQKAIQMDPSQSSNAMMNLATYYAEEGDLDSARWYYQQAYKQGDRDGLIIRMAVLIPPIMMSREAVLESRQRFEENLRLLHSWDPSLQIENPVRTVDRVHFYLVYHGYNDRPLQELLTSLYWKSCPSLHYVAPHLQDAGILTVDQTTKRIRVGFCSKFFGPYEPHGLLLRGIMAGLPRNEFEVILFWVSGSHLDEGIAKSVDEVIKLSYVYSESRRIIAEARLDILVFADMMSEPMNHFLGYARLAKVQCLFWGNPITSGNPNVDYFISADRMEPLKRTAFTEADEPYTEQVVLLDGQGIWYDRPVNFPAKQPRAKYGLQEGWFVYLCAQSLFKLHPDYDFVLSSILNRVPGAHLVFTKGRRDSWTRTFQQRLIGSFPELSERIHFVERQPAGDAFLQLLLTADVILHPFPFGGSRTSAEGLSLGLPVVALRANFLRGRMAASFYDSMGMQDFVAETPEQYIQTAVKLGLDAEYRAEISSRIRDQVDLIWEDKSVVFEWTRFLRTAAGQNSLDTDLIQASWKQIPEFSQEEGMLTQESLQSNHIGVSESAVGTADNWHHTQEDQNLFLDEVYTAALELYSQGKVEETLNILEYVAFYESVDPKILNLMKACKLQIEDSP